MTTSIFKTALHLLLPLMGMFGLVVVGCGTTTTESSDDEHVGAADQALTAAQCNYFATNGKVQICHRTGSTKNPYSILKVSEQACVNAHAVHAGDYVAVNDPQCQGVGCLPQGAPCDPTVPCCDGFSCTNGTCTPNISNHCDPSPCQNGGSCTNDSNGYTCSCPAGYTGTNCDIEIDECQSNPCVQGQCLDGIDSYVCECSPGWTGTNCDIDIDECASNPCVNGQCTDQINGYSCACDPGWSGTNCEVQDPVVTCPCHDDTGWQYNMSVCDYFVDEYGIQLVFEGASNNGMLTTTYCQSSSGDRPLTPEQFNVCLAEISSPCGHLISPCEGSSCAPYGGTCVAGANFSYTCECFDGFYGPNCAYY